jgi:CheY-like chemotaxis protein
MTPRILCIDDNRDVADSEAMLLRVVGIEANACYGGEDALAEALAFRPTMCLIDLNMPGMDGDELGMRLRAQARQPLVLVAVTAMDDTASQERIKAAGFDQHLVKPGDPVKLLALVEQCELLRSHP